jgi:Rap1a immunity proteins
MKLVLSVICGILTWANALTNEARAEWAVTFYTGGDLLQMCTGPERIGCSAYIAGASDAITSQRASEGKPACLLPSVPIGQVVAVTLNYLRSHPDMLSSSAAYLVNNAITLEWKC